MELGRPLLRWAVPGWCFFLFLSLFELTFRAFLRSEPPLASAFPKLPSVETATLILAAVGLALGFLLAQVDAVVRTSALLPMTSGIPDPGGEIISVLGRADRQLVRRVMAARSAASDWSWSEPTPTSLPKGLRLPWWEGGLWLMLGLFWVADRARRRNEIQLNADLADIYWMRATEDDRFRRLRERVLDLKDREDTLGAVRIALFGAYLFGYTANLGFLEPSVCTLGSWVVECGTALILGAALVAVLGLVAIFTVRERVARVWGVPLTFAIVALLLLRSLGAGRMDLVMDRTLELATWLAAVLAVVWIVQLVYRRVPVVVARFASGPRRRRQLIRARSHIARTLVHLSALGALGAVGFWWTLPYVDSRLTALGLAYLANLGFLLALWRLLNTARRLVRERRIALQVAHIARAPGEHLSFPAMA